MFKQLDEDGRVVAIWATPEEIKTLRRFAADAPKAISAGDPGPLRYFGVPVLAHEPIPESMFEPGDLAWLSEMP